MKQGKVYLVGAGPGDPGLLTVKGLEYLKQADVVIYDRLLDSRILNMARRNAEKIYVGKSSHGHCLEQEDINRLLVEKALSGKMVVRLKGGDPFVFGRGGEEAESLSSNHISFEVVPGVSSAVACPAFAGIPVTHRGLSSSFLVTTGHEASNKNGSSVDWEQISQGADTIVILMAVSNLRRIIGEFLKNGKPESTPIAVITNGTSNQQQTLLGTLGNIVGKAERAKLEPPAVLVVGEVVRLRDRLCWFDNTPLFGKHVLVTRAKKQATELSELLMVRGAIPVEMPAIEIFPVFEELDQAISKLRDYQWLIFTSVNGVEIFFQRLQSSHSDSRALAHLQIGAIGKGTAGALNRHGIQPDCVPARYSSRDLLGKLSSQRLAGCWVLLLRADIAGKELANGLIKLGAKVHEIAAYRTVPNKKRISEAKEMLLNGKIDIITFTSASTVKNLVAVLGKNKTALNNAIIACIGHVTSSAATGAGLRVDIVAEEHTMAGLIEAIEQYLSKERNNERLP